MAEKILIINGPNLNMLGKRETNIYGSQTLADIEKLAAEEAKVQVLEIDFRQSNSEGEMVDWIQEAGNDFKGVIINPAGYTHSSVAIRDALLTLSIPVIEVHLSNIFKREDFRHHSYVSPVAHGVICGFGGIGYAMALKAIKELI